MISLKEAVTDSVNLYHLFLLSVKEKIVREFLKPDEIGKQLGEESLREVIENSWNGKTLPGAVTIVKHL